MEAIRRITQLEDVVLTLQLPDSFRARRVEVIVLPLDETPMADEHGVAGIRRRPSPRLQGTRIMGDIMTPVVPEEDWDALK